MHPLHAFLVALIWLFIVLDAFAIGAICSARRSKKLFEMAKASQQRLNAIAAMRALLQQATGREIKVETLALYMHLSSALAILSTAGSYPSPKVTN